jgi:hypothetical protein
VLTFVCSRLRAMLSDMPPLWTDVVFSQSEAWADRCLAHSVSHPPRVNFDLREGFGRRMSAVPGLGARVAHIALCAGSPLRHRRHDLVLPELDECEVAQESLPRPQALSGFIKRAQVGKHRIGRSRRRAVSSARSPQVRHATRPPCIASSGHPQDPAVHRRAGQGSSLPARNSSRPHQRAVPPPHGVTLLRAVTTGHPRFWVTQCPLAPAKFSSRRGVPRGIYISCVSLLDRHDVELRPQKPSRPAA